MQRFWKLAEVEAVAEPLRAAELVCAQRHSAGNDNQIYRAIVEVLKNPDLREQLIQRGFEPIGNSPKEFAAFISLEIAKWAKVVRLAGIEPE